MSEDSSDAPSGMNSNDEPVLVDFDSGKAANDWRPVHDTVMGGRSSGSIEMTANTMVFSGNLSLENNGGFASARSAIALDLGDYDGIRLRVKGDGRKYSLRLQTDARLREQWAVSYGAEFETQKDEWIVAKVPFANLQQQFRGMRLTDYPFDASKIELIGILLGDKKPGEFEIEIDWIAAYQEETGETIAQTQDPE